MYRRHVHDLRLGHQARTHQHRLRLHLRRIQRLADRKPKVIIEVFLYLEPFFSLTHFFIGLHSQHQFQGQGGGVEWTYIPEFAKLIYLNMFLEVPSRILFTVQVLGEDPGGVPAGGGGADILRRYHHVLAAQPLGGKQQLYS